MNTIYIGCVNEIAENVKQYIDDRHGTDVQESDIYDIVNFILIPFFDCVDQQGATIGDCDV